MRAYLGELAADCHEFLLKLSIGVMYFGIGGIDGFFLGRTKLRNQIVEIGGSLRNFSGRFLQIRSALRGIMADAGNGTDIFGHVAGRFCGACQARGHLIGAGRLLFDGGGNRSRNRVDLGDDAIDAADGIDSLFGITSNGLDHRGYFFRGSGGLSGQFFDFTGDHGEASADFAGPSGFDGGI